MSAPDIDSGALRSILLKGHYTDLLISLVVVGIEVFICTFTLSVVFSSKGIQKGRIPYIVISFAIFAMSLVRIIADAYKFYVTFTGSTSGPELLLALFSTSAATVVDRLTLTNQLMWAFITLTADGLLLYRCYVMWQHRKIVLVFPTLVYVSMYALNFYYRLSNTNIAGRDQMTSIYISITVLFNVVLTFLICSRLIQARRTVIRALIGVDASMISTSGRSESYAEIGRPYDQVMNILIESAAPIAIFGMAYVGLLICKMINNSRGGFNTMQLISAQYALSTLYISSVILSPQILIFTVTNGRSWAQKTEYDRTTIHDEGATVSHIVFSSARSDCSIPV